MNLTCCYVILLFYFCRKFLHIHYYLYLQLSANLIKILSQIIRKNIISLMIFLPIKFVPSSYHSRTKFEYN